MNTESTASRPRSLLARIFRWAVGLAAAMVVAVMLSILVEWIGLTFFWPEQGAARSEAVLRQDLAWLRGSPADPIVLPFATLPAPSALAADMSADLYRILFVLTGIEAAVGWVASVSARAAIYVQAALNAAQTFFVRFAITLTAIPLFILFAWWGGLEGMVRRDLRRFGGDVERGMVYHWAKHVAGATLVIPVILYFAWPGSVNPAWLFVPFALALAVNIMVVTSTFTKYV